MIYSAEPYQFAASRAIDKSFDPQWVTYKLNNGLIVRLPPRRSLILPYKNKAHNGPFGVGGHIVGPPPNPPPTTFFNALVTYSKYCSGGQHAGLPVCVTVNAMVFSSMISQVDADTHARYIAEVTLCPMSPGPCCVGSPQPPSWIGDFPWTFSDGGSPPANTGAAVTHSGTPSTTYGCSVTQNPVDIGASVTASATSIQNFCNSYPTYVATLSFDFVVSGTSAANQNSAGWSLFFDGGFIDNEGFTADTSGHKSFNITIDNTGPHSFQFSFVATKVVDNNAGSPNITISNLQLRPLQPAITTQPCTIISVPPVPDNYALRPANDDFGSATVISGSSGTINGTNLYASLEPGEPSVQDNIKLCSSIWYDWTAPANGTATFNTDGSDFDTVLACYTGNSVDALTLIAFNDDGPVPPQSQITFTAVAGTAYRIAVDGFNGVQGNVVLNWSLV